MSFPQIRDVVSTFTSLSDTVIDFDLPSYQAGDLLVACFRQSDTINPNDGTTVPSGWTATEANKLVFWRIADGSEGSAVTVTTDANRRRAVVCYAIHGYDGDAQSFIESLTAQSASVNNDAPELSPSWGSADVLWLCMWSARVRNVTFSATPDGYSGLVEAGDPSGATSTSYAYTAVVSKTATAASDNPSAWNAGGNDSRSRATTIAILGASGDPDPGGDPPQGTTIISDVTPGVTTAEVTYSYNDTDQTGFEYRIDEGAASAIDASPATITGLTAATPYNSPGIQVRAINAEGPGAWSTAVPFTTEAEPPAPTINWSVAPAVASVTQNSITVTATPDTECDVYAVALRSTQSVPNEAQIVAGTDGDDQPAAATAVESSTGSEVTLTLSGLTQDPSYRVFVVAAIPE